MHQVLKCEVLYLFQFYNCDVSSFVEMALVFLFMYKIYINLNVA